MNSSELNLLDFPFLDYTQRQLSEISREGIENSLEKISPSGHFTYQHSKWEAVAYPGYGILSRVLDNPGNQILGPRLVELQNEIHFIIKDEGAYYRLPPESFHQTIANTLSADRFIKHIVSPGLEKEYPEIIRQSFKKIRSYYENEPIRMSLVGIGIFKTAIGILGVFKKEDDYLRICTFRQKFYGYHPLQELGIRMTRPFIGHITLGYFEKPIQTSLKPPLIDRILALNEDLFQAPPVFSISQAALYRYDNLSLFYGEENFPVHNF